MWWAPTGSERLNQTSVKVGQPWSNLVKVGQTSLKSGKCAPDPVYGSDRLCPSCLVLHADTRENPGGKNRVMTVTPSLFGVS